MIRKVAVKDSSWQLEHRLAFNAGNLTAGWENTGRILGDYVVRSYGVPIAVWRYDGTEWFTPKRYSVTTSRHTNMVKRAWGRL
jgi:hypothetical protein